MLDNNGKGDCIFNFFINENHILVILHIIFINFGKFIIIFFSILSKHSKKYECGFIISVLNIILTMLV